MMRRYLMLLAGLLGAGVVHLLHREHQLGLADLGVVRPLGLVAQGQVAGVVVVVYLQSFDFTLEIKPL